MVLRLIGWLAITLAVLSAAHVRVWESDVTLWPYTARVSPTSTRALINAGAVKIQHGDYAGAELLFQQAAALVGTQPEFELAWTTDVLQANWAVLNIARGQWAEAHQRIQNAPKSSMREKVCLQFQVICRMVPS